MNYGNEDDEMNSAYCEATTATAAKAAAKSAAGAHTIKTQIISEATAYSTNKSHTSHLCISFNAIDTGLAYAYADRIPVDMVIVTDLSTSMSEDNKLPNVLSAIEYIISVLRDKDRLAVVTFSDTASVLIPLQYMNDTNKRSAVTQLHSAVAQGNTNISEGLFTGLSILKGRKDEELPISRLFLLTDGLANRGLDSLPIIDILKKMDLPPTLTICCFGFGCDHEASALQEIAFSTSGGLYYFIETPERISATFGECIAGVFSTVAYNIKVELEAFDGCRFLQFRTKFPRKTITQMKYYVINLGSMYEQESRSIVIKNSLRAMNSDCDHHLFRMTVTYISAIDRKQKLIQNLFSVTRTSNPKLLSQPVPPELLIQLHRVNAADAIDVATKHAMMSNYGNAKKILNDAISEVYQSPAFCHSYCSHLVEDLNRCQEIVSDPVRFQSFGKSQIHQYSTMYHQERSVGINANPQEVTEPLLSSSSSSSQSSQTTENDYGSSHYRTKTQQQEGSTASSKSLEYLSGYVSFM